MTVAQFFATHQQHGRAVVDGTVAAPSKWIAANPWAGPGDYLVCFESIDAVRWCRGTQPLDHVVTPPRRSRVQGITRWTV